MNRDIFKIAVDTGFEFGSNMGYLAESSKNLIRGPLIEHSVGEYGPG